MIITDRAFEVNGAGREMSDYRNSAESKVERGKVAGTTVGEGVL